MARRCRVPGFRSRHRRATACVGTVPRSCERDGNVSGALRRGAVTRRHSDYHGGPQQDSSGEPYEEERQREVPRHGSDDGENLAPRAERGGHVEPCIAEKHGGSNDRGRSEDLATEPRRPCRVYEHCDESGVEPDPREAPVVGLEAAGEADREVRRPWDQTDDDHQHPPRQQMMELGDVNAPLGLSAALMLDDVHRRHRSAGEEGPGLQEPDCPSTPRTGTIRVAVEK